MRSPAGVSGRVGRGDPGPYGREQHGPASQKGLRVVSGTWPLTRTSSSALILRGLHNGARAPGVLAAAARPALPLLQQPAPCCRWLCLQGPGPAHGEQCHCPVHGSQDPAVRSPAGVGQAGAGELVTACPCRVPRRLHQDSAPLAKSRRPAHPPPGSLPFPSIAWHISRTILGLPCPVQSCRHALRFGLPVSLPASLFASLGLHLPLSDHPADAGTDLGSRADRSGCECPTAPWLPVTPGCAHSFRRKMEAAGFTILGANHPICPVMLGDARLASCMADDMLKRGKETETRGVVMGPKRREKGTPVW